jgi:hypothetical protein
MIEIKYKCLICNTYFKLDVPIKQLHCSCCGNTNNKYFKICGCKAIPNKKIKEVI